MPTINVKRDLLMKKFGRNYTDKEFDELCFAFGIELDEITSEKKMALKEKGSTGKESDDVIYKIDLPANRYDLLSLEGLAFALNIFTGRLKLPEFRTKPSDVKFHVDEHANNVRPVLLGAIVRNIKFDQDLYDSFIDLQDKIHQNIGRKRSKVSIGTHDLDTLKPPFLYTALPPKELKFVPLNQDREFTGEQLMEFYADSHLKSYLPLIKDKDRYPAIFDQAGTCLSMPPIINGNVSKITLDTKNILIEITATDRDRARIALDTIVAMLVTANGSYEAESVQIDHVDGRTYVVPDFTTHGQILGRDYINKSLGIEISSEKIADLLNKMSLKAEVQPNGNDIKIWVPPTRHDIMDKCDVMEDVGIAYGYDNIVKTIPKSGTIASQVFLNKLSDLIRHEMARCGYTEALNFALCSVNELTQMLRKPKGDDIVEIANPKTSEFQAARTSLLPGLLKTILSNNHMPLPLKVFEVSDVVVADPKKDVGARNVRHIAAVYYGKDQSGFTQLHGLLDRLMSSLYTPNIALLKDRESKEWGYYIKYADYEPYLPGRCAAIYHSGKHIGHLGIIHPDVLSNFELNRPASALELNLEAMDLSNDRINKMLGRT